MTYGGTIPLLLPLTFLGVVHVPRNNYIIAYYSRKSITKVSTICYNSVKSRPAEVGRREKAMAVHTIAFCHPHIYH